MDERPLYAQEHRREPRICLSWRATMRPASGGSSSSACTTTNVSPAGVCLRGAVPGSVTSARDERWVLDLSLPGGGRVEGIEMAAVWSSGQGQQALSGWRFTRVGRTVRRALKEELGLAGVPGPGYEYWEEDEVELWDYVKVLIRRRWLIAACVGLAALVAYTDVALEPPVYTATAQVYSVGEVDYLSLREGLTVGKTAPFVAVLRSVPLNRRMVHKPYTIVMPDSSAVTRTLVEWSVARGAKWNLDQTAEILARPLEPGAQRRREVGAIGWLQGMAGFDQGKDGILTVRVDAEFPGLAAQIANGYVEELGGYQLETSTVHTQRNLSMAKARMDTLQRELRTAQRALETFQVANQNLLRDMRDVNLLLPEVGTKLDSLQRELDLKKQLYTTVAQQYELLRLQREKEATGLEVISQAEPPLQPATKTRKYTMLGALVGLFLGVFLAFLAEYLASKRRAGDLQPLAAAWREDMERVRGLLGR